MSMHLNELIERCALVPVQRGGIGNPIVLNITYDSRKVTAGTLYVAIPGTKVHGDNFITDAIYHGAAVIISENSHPELSIPWLQVENVRALLGELGKKLWHWNEEKATIVGITGTNGKTTVAHLYESLFSHLHSPDNVWMFGTIQYHIDGNITDATHTTPEALEIFRRVGDGIKKPEVIVMEVSSHSLALDRIGGLKYDVAVFTNLTQDHLDFHQNMDAYYAAKLRLFDEYLKPDGYAIVNIDDTYGSRLVADLEGKQILTYGRDTKADVRIISWECDWDGCRIEIDYKGKEMRFSSSLCGFFNIYNMAALIAGGLVRRCTSRTIQSALDKVPTVNGRMDRIDLNAAFTVVVDYAHTPDALINVLGTAKTITRGRLLCVFGCGGDRDRKKRPLMGAAVAQWCDEAWVTSDNPRSERPETIIQDIVDGIPLDFPQQVIPNRKDAIAAALQAARPDDCLIIAGKGHETYQEIGGVKHHFDDKEVVRSLFADRRKEMQSYVE